MSEAPYQVEYAKSGRAACKGCKSKIEQGDIRIAVMVQSAFFDGKQPNWHHEECFFKRQRPKSTVDIANFNNLRSADQKRITQKISDSDGSAPVEESGKGKKKGKKRVAENPGASITALQDFCIEYSKSSRATCRHCDIKICKDEIRVCKTVYDTEVGQKYGGQPLWHHLACFAKERANLQYYAGPEDLNGFKTLTKSDQAVVKKELKPLEMDGVQVKKMKEEPKDEQQIKEEAELEKKMEKQNKLFFKFRDAMRDFSKEDLHNLLEMNSQEIFVGNDKCLDHLADCMAFGALKPCPECKNGQLVLDNFNYKCTGDISEWSKCAYTSAQPARVAMLLPDSIRKKAPFKSIKKKMEERAFRPQPTPTASAVAVVKSDPDAAEKPAYLPPLKNLQFFLYGKGKSEDVKRRILKLGGLVVSKLTDTLAAVVSTPADVEKMSNKMQDIQEKDVEVIEASLFDTLDKDGTVAKTLELIKVNNIASWGSDPTKRVPQDVIDGKSIEKSGSNYVAKSSKSTKLKVKGGTAVDPDSGLEDVAHVYTDAAGRKYTVVLSKTDVVTKKNSYYKLQLLMGDSVKNYWVFRSWGRIGTPIGGTKVENCRGLDHAKCLFEKLYEERTKNPWNQPADMFEKFPNCYVPVETDYGPDEAEAGGAGSQGGALAADDSSWLPLPVQQLVIKIFDIQLMKKAMLEFELDTEKMPLGKLSKKQIKSGYTTLSDLLKQIEKNDSNRTKIIEYTNKFFTTIPHDFGMDNAPLLDNIEAINKKREMLDNLLEIEIAYSLLTTDSKDTKSPVETHYARLKAEIAPLEHDSDDFKLIREYVANTHAATHQSYDLNVQQAFKVVREGEDKRFKPFRKLHNRRLLWHGSRVTNFAGILSQGLRIAPPEAPSTGYMFGKGIYFADMVSKSANYCCTSKQNPVGIMLLCEVALGDMKQFHQASFVKSLPDANSVWGVGRTQPDPAGARVLPDGVVVPLGTPVMDHKLNSSLLYNEFIVYDVAQVRVRYLMEMEFKFKY